MAALAGTKVVEIAGLAPVPFAGMILADFGASVTRVDRLRQAATTDILARGKRSIAIDLKKPKGAGVARRLCARADVLIEPFRPGVMEKLGLGPDILMAENPRLIYARLTGFGQTGLLSKRAGHDINYLSISGLLSTLGRKDENPVAPVNLLADFAGGGASCVMGILLALIERSKSGKGQVIDAAMVEGAAYTGSFIYNTQGNEFIWRGERGTNMLDTGAPFYNTYQTADNKFVAVGAIEPQFYAQLIKGMSLNEDELPAQMDAGKWPALKEKFAKVFASKTRSEWCEIFDQLDACVTPVLTLDEAPEHPHNRQRKVFIKKEEGVEPAPAPKLSRTPGDERQKAAVQSGAHTVEVMLEVGYSAKEIKELLEEGVVDDSNTKASL